VIASDLPLYVGIPLALMCMATVVFMIGSLVIFWRGF
jgi:hypothetical protein